MKNKKAYYLRNNPNLNRIRDDYWTEKKVKAAIESVSSEKWIDEPAATYSISIRGTAFNLSYEEMVEILAGMRDCALGNEAFLTAKLKADKMFSYLPVTDY